MTMLTLINSSMFLSPGHNRNWSMTSLKMNIDISVDIPSPTEYDFNEMSKATLFKLISTPRPIRQMPLLDLTVAVSWNNEKISPEQQNIQKMPVFSSKTLSQRWKPQDPNDHREDNSSAADFRGHLGSEDTRLFPRTCSSRSIKECPFNGQIKPTNQITIPLGQENAFFNRLCDILDTAIQEWESFLLNHESLKDPDPHEIDPYLSVPEIEETLVFGIRPGMSRFWEGDVSIYPECTRVVKLTLKYEDPGFFGVHIGRIFGFWDLTWREGVEVWYGFDGKMYVGFEGQSGSDEGWSLYRVTGPWNLREFGCDAEINDHQYPL